ncbi:MAG TPA: DUF5682 family protein, partial [Myxococcaceae bacterium]|nr:DUF5682 family protein [Myxococcaceae bacterium]
GFRSFEEFWEAQFEAPEYAPADFRPALLAWAELVRHDGRDDFNRVRDAFMAKRILELVEKGTTPEKIAVVVGAAHAAAFVERDVELTLLEKLPQAVPSAVTVIPFSFPRLSEQLGYGAGNRAPQYYQRAHDAGVDFHRATLEVLLDFATHLRLRGFIASLADVLEAYRLAVSLAAIREKSAPGLDEVREATIATLCRGDASHVDGFLWRSVIGHKVGRVAGRIGRNSLQEEFWREVRERRLPQSDAPEQFTLRLNNEVEVGTSIFLHRLRMSTIPYASVQTSTPHKRGLVQPTHPAAGGYAALARVKEVWTAQWTPSTDIALVERIVLGDTLEQVTTRALQESLEKAKTTADAAAVLLESVVTASPLTIAAALHACDTHAATDVDLPSLASAASALSMLVSYGSSRSKADVAIGDQSAAIEALLRRTFSRALLRADDAARCPPEAVPPIIDALRTLHEVALAQPLVDTEGWYDRARALSATQAVNAAISGLCTGLLFLSQRMTEAHVADEVGRRVSPAVKPGDTASFIEGFFAVNALVLVKNKDVVRALDGFLCAMGAETYRQTLPVLRRAFGALGASERRYLLENIVALRQLKEEGRAVKALMEERDKEKLKEMSAEIGKALDDLDDLL